MRSGGVRSRARKRLRGHKASAPRRKTKPAASAAIRIRRVYDPPNSDDGLRILVDRLWPRGMSKAKVKADAWPKELAPSTALRRWYAHDPEHREEFRRRYRDELQQRSDDLAKLRAAVRGRKVTLLTATRELELSHAEVLREVLMRRRER
jgi:uncharacterized protein YeaO (DUF488 family)